MPKKKKTQGYKARQDESLGARRGARSKLKGNVTKAGRRAMASGPCKAAGGKKYGLKPRKKKQMPKVGKKHFPYTKKGYAAAAKAKAAQKKKSKPKKKN